MDFYYRPFADFGPKKSKMVKMTILSKMPFLWLQKWIHFWSQILSHFDLKFNFLKFKLKFLILKLIFLKI